MTITGQNFTIRRGEARTIQFKVELEAGATAFSWYTAANRASDTRDLSLASGGSGITFADNGDDCDVFVTISKVQSEALPVGWRYHELFGVDAAGQDRHFSEGGMVVEESLRTVPT